MSRSDFAGELKKYIPVPANGAGELSQKAAAKPAVLNTPGSGLKASSAGPGAGTKNSGPSVKPAQKRAPDSKPATNGRKSKATTAESAVATNAAVASKVLADLQYPAETRQACQGLENKEGSLSVKDLKSLLDTQSQVGSANSGAVPAEHAKELVNSIVVKGSAINHPGSSSSGTPQACLQVKPEGSYTHDEFVGLIQKILQNAEPTQVKTAGSASSPDSTQTVKTSGTLKASQTQRLTSSILPSFISDGSDSISKGSDSISKGSDSSSKDSENDKANKASRPQVKNPVPDAKSINTSGTSEEVLGAVSNGLNSDPAQIDSKTGGSSNAGEGLAPGGTTGSESGNSASTPGPTFATSSAGRTAAEMPIGDLDSILKNFGARIMSADPQQSEATTVIAPAPGGPVEGSAALAQNMATHVKGAEKEAESSRGTLSSPGLPQHSTDQSGMGRIKAAVSDYLSSQGSFYSNPDGFADPAKKNDAGTPAAKFDPQETAGKQATIDSGARKTVSGQPDEISGKTGAETLQAETLYGKPADSAGVLEPEAALSSAGADNEAGMQETIYSAERKTVSDQPDGISGKTGPKTLQAETLSGKPADSAEVLKPEAALSSAGADNEAGTQKTIDSAERKTVSDQPDEISGKTGAETLQAETLSGKPADSAGRLEHRADLSHTAGTESDENAAAPRDDLINGRDKATPVVVSEGPAMAGIISADKAELPSEVLRVGSPVENFETASDETIYGAASALGLHESTSATSGINPVDTANSRVALSGEATSIKDIAKELGDKDSIPENAVYQSSASSSPGSGTNQPQMENSAQSAPPFDPSRMAEYVQDMREQFTGSSNRHLILEMEPAALGKISLKVESKKDEISVVALTDSETARQTLMKHSPELRQGLQDQGLVLDKFMVDVNSEKSGGGNYPEDNTPKRKTQPVLKTAKVGDIQASAGPAYIRQTDSKMQVNIFA